MCTFALKDTEVMYLVKNTFIHDIHDDEVQDEWETKSCPGRLEEAVCTEELGHDSKCVDVPQYCTTITKPSYDSAVPCCTTIAGHSSASLLSMDSLLWPLRLLCNRELGYCAWIAPEPLDIPLVSKGRGAGEGRGAGFFSSTENSSHGSGA